MSYLGSSAAPLPVAFAGQQGQSFNGGTNTFTLSRAVARTLDIDLIVNNVLQNPYDGSYSVSGNVVTTAETVSAGVGNVYVIFRDAPIGSFGPIDGSVTTPKLVDSAVTTAKIADANVTQAKLAANVAGNGPVLYSGGATSISVPNVTTTFFTSFNASVYDTGNAFSTTTGRFTPQTAGWYLVVARVGFDSNGITASSFSAGVYKNGSTSPVSYQGMAGNGGGFPSPQCSAIVYLNGSTDYAQVGAYHNAGSTAIGVYAHLQACLVRAA